MGIWNRVVEFFVKDSAERKRFVKDFNSNASFFFQSLAVDTLLEARICYGNPDNSYRHELSAPSTASQLLRNDISYSTTIVNYLFDIND